MYRLLLKKKKKLIFLKPTSKSYPENLEVWRSKYFWSAQLQSIFARAL